MSNKQVEALKGHYAFKEWSNINRLKENLFVRYFQFLPLLFPGWHIHRSRIIEQAGLPLKHMSTWQRDNGDPDTVLRVETYECSSRAAAHEMLLEILAGFQSPGVLRSDDLDIGDVVFTVPGNAGIAFARANMAVFVSNAGRKQVSIPEIAHLLDHAVYDKPEAAQNEAPELLMKFAGRGSDRLKTHEVRSLQVEMKNKEQSCYKFFSTQGEVLLEDDNLAFRAEKSGEPDVTLFTVSPDGQARKRKFSLRVGSTATAKGDGRPSESAGDNDNNDKK